MGRVAAVTTPLPQFPDSLCHSCVHKKDVKTRTSVFLLCQVQVMEDKYPAQPVRACGLFVRLAR